MATPALPAPTRKTTEPELDKFNQQLRASPEYQALLKSFNLNPNKPVGLSRSQQGKVQEWLASKGLPMQSGMHVDHAGNLNQKNRLARNTAITLGLVGATIATAGAAGAFSGAAGGAAAGGAGAAGAGAAGTAGAIGGGAAAAGAGAAGVAAGTGAAAGGIGLGTAASGALAGGGILSKVMTGAKYASPILGAMAGSRADALQGAERAQFTRDSLDQGAAEARERSILARAGVDLEQRKFQEAAPGMRMTNSVRGSLLSNAKPITVGRGGPMTLQSGRSISPIHFGGFDPSLLSANTRQLGDAVTGQALEAQLKGDKFEPLPQTSFPGGTPAPQAGMADKLIGGAATGAAILGSMSPILSRIRRPAPTVPGALPEEPRMSAFQNPAIYGGIKF